jgi:polysaccharide biosynthesis/export protein
VVSVPKAEMIYVVGAVNKAGAFVLSQRTSVSVLQALSMAEGLEKTAAGGRARIIHQGPNNEKKEIPTDLNKILSGNSSDVQLVANDILFVPNSGAKTVGYRAMEAAVQAATGVLIYRP